MKHDTTKAANMFTKETARREGAKGGRAKARTKLTLTQVENELGVLTTLEDAQRRLDRIGVWALSGLLAGSVAGASVRSVEVWVRTHESRLTQEVVTDLRQRLDELEAQIKQRSTIGVVR